MTPGDTYKNPAAIPEDGITEGYYRLACAAVSQAVLDLSHRRRAVQLDALLWLISEDSRPFLAMAGLFTETATDVLRLIRGARHEHDNRRKRYSRDAKNRAGQHEHV